VDDHSSWENVVPVLRSYEENSHVQVIYRETNGHISVATNDGIKCATGEFIAFMDCDDIIDPDALYEMAKMLNENPELDFIYSDEDKITEDGKIRHLPFFKPDWSPDLFMSMMYTNHLAIYRTSIVKKIGGLRSAYDGCQDYDMTLRFMEKSNNKKVGHVSKILYHWRERKESLAFAVASKNYATEATRYAKEDALRRRKLKGHMEFIPEMSQYRTVYEIQEEPLVSIIIPSKDHPDVLKQCIDSIIGFTSYSNYEIIVVDNGSNDENKEEIERYLENKKIKYIYNSYEFNFSKMCNIGSNASRGEYVLFLNDDVEIIQSDWMSRMMGQAMLPHVGCVGAKLFYPESTVIQHAGVSNIKEGPSHNFLWCDDSASYSMGFNWIDYDCIVVTGACLLVSKKIFNDIGNFDESFPVAYNDVDLCFRVYEA
jgi:glycosyltransferase involved in cell wall biosynthesis